MKINEQLDNLQTLRENLAKEIWGFTRDNEFACVCHNTPQTRESFRDEISWKEFGISGLCQLEQDSFFGMED